MILNHGLNFVYALPMAKKQHNCTPVGITDIADFTGLKPQTLSLYVMQGITPPNRWLISGRTLVWCKECDIAPWWAERLRKRSAS